MAEGKDQTEQTLDLLGQLMTRGRRWEYAVVVILITAVFSAGVTVQRFRGQFAALTETQVSIKQSFDAMVVDLDSRTAERHANEATVAARLAVHQQNISDLTVTMRQLSEALLRITDSAEKHAEEDHLRERQQAELTTAVALLTQNQENVLRLIDRVDGEVEDLRRGAREDERDQDQRDRLDGPQ